MDEAAASALRRHVKAEKIRLPAACFERSVAWTLLYAGRPFALILLAFGALLAVPLPGWIAWPMAAVALLLAQRHFQTLVHDSSHAFFARRRDLNDRLANWLAAGWIGMTVANYRAIHFKHHAHNGSADDPEHVSFRTVEEAGGLLVMVLRYALLLETLRLVRKYYGRKERPERRRPPHDETGGRGPFAQAHVMATQGVLAGVCLAAGLPGLYLLWAYLAVSFSPLLSRLRFLVEHPGESDLTVTTESSLLERPFFAPLNFNYHFEHHCWPSLPPYRLRQANRYLIEQGFFDRHPEYANPSFTGSLIRRSSTRTGIGEPAL